MHHELQKKYGFAAKMFLRSSFESKAATSDMIQNLQNLDLELIKDKNKKHQILKYMGSSSTLFKRKKGGAVVNVFNHNGKNYIFIKKIKVGNFLIVDNGPNKASSLYLVLVFAIILLALILSFVTTIRKLMPLKRLKDKVVLLGDENYDFECCDTGRKDEVSLLAAAFKQSAKKLKKPSRCQKYFYKKYHA
jgi:two-component system OmpR family sensor kinase